MSEWQDMQKKPRTKLQDLLKNKKAKTRKLSELSKAEENRLAKLNAMLDELRRGENPGAQFSCNALWQKVKKTTILLCWEVVAKYVTFFNVTIEIQ